jgi:hypothetical protein
VQKQNECASPRAKRSCPLYNKKLLKGTFVVENLVLDFKVIFRECTLLARESILMFVLA